MKFMTSKKVVSANNEKLVEAAKKASLTFPENVKVTGSKIEVSGVEYPQFDTVDEFVKSAGSDKDAVEYINRHAENDAKNIVRTGTRNASEEIGAAQDKLTQLFVDLMKGAKDWIPSSRGIGVAAKAKALDAAKDAITKAQNEGRTLSNEELLALLDASR